MWVITHGVAFLVGAATSAAILLGAAWYHGWSVRIRRAAFLKELEGAMARGGADADAGLVERGRQAGML